MNDIISNAEREEYAALVEAERRVQETEAAVKERVDGFEKGVESPEHRICWAIIKGERLRRDQSTLRLTEPHRAAIDAALPAYEAFNAAGDALEALRKSGQKSEFDTVRERAWAGIDAPIEDLLRYDKENGTNERANWHNYVYALSQGPIKETRNSLKIVFANNVHHDHGIVQMLTALGWSTPAEVKSPTTHSITDKGRQALQRMNERFGPCAWESTNYVAPPERSPFRGFLGL